MRQKFLVLKFIISTDDKIQAKRNFKPTQASKQKKARISKQ